MVLQANIDIPDLFSPIFSLPSLLHSLCSKRGILAEQGWELQSSVSVYTGCIQAQFLSVGHLFWQHS